MKITIQAAENYPVEQLVLPIKELIITGFEEKFTFIFLLSKNCLKLL